MHYVVNHDNQPSKLDAFVEQFHILFSSNEPTLLKITEVIYIKHYKPNINIKYNELYDVPGLF